MTMLLRSYRSRRVANAIPPSFSRDVYGIRTAVSGASRGAESGKGRKTIAGVYEGQPRPRTRLPMQSRVRPRQGAGVAEGLVRRPREAGNTMSIE